MRGTFTTNETNSKSFPRNDLPQARRWYRATGLHHPQKRGRGSCDRRLYPGAKSESCADYGAENEVNENPVQSMRMFMDNTRWIEHIQVPLAQHKRPLLLD
jgi:hypothetical protein